MPRIPLRFPPPGENQIADAIRKRRAPRDLINLDGVLLHNPEIASGWSSLLGAVRTKSSLPDDVRELLILRVAARNGAAYEWHHHESVGRNVGLTTPQLAVIRDIYHPIPSPSSPGPLTPLQAAALSFGDAMTANVRVPKPVVEALKKELGTGEKADQMMLEVTATVATYNMVSRVLVALDVTDTNDKPVPFPGLKTEELRVPTGEEGQSLFVRVSKHEEGEAKPWLVFVNSLLTNLSMWDQAAASLSAKYNIVCYDQRGHGKSTVPSQPCTVAQLADDVSLIVSHLSLPTPIHALIGVSQGGATALCTAIRHPSLFSRIVACDTQASSPAANKAAWEERIELAKKEGMGRLAVATVGRWFPEGSECHPDGGRGAGPVLEMVENTSVEGFTAGARALQSYDLSADLSKAFTSGAKGLLVAGERDGKLPDTLKALGEKLRSEGGNVGYEVVPGAGHLPMVDQTAKWLAIVEKFLNI